MASLILFVILGTTANNYLLAAAAAPRINSNVQSTFIVNGQIAEKPIPYQVNIKLAEDRQHYCGGILIDHQHVLTAAHCVMYRTHTKGVVFPPSTFRVVLGDLKDEETGEVEEAVVDVVSIKAHSKFNYTFFRDDVAVLKLKQKVKFTENIEAVALPISEVPPGTQCQTSGWGSLGNGRQPNRLRYTGIDTMTIKKCIDYLNEPIKMGPEAVKRFEDKVLCAGKPSRMTGANGGDSGGPLVCSSNKGQISGITSFTNFGEGKWVTVFTSVFAYRKWIEEAIVKMADE